MALTVKIEEFTGLFLGSSKTTQLSSLLSRSDARHVQLKGLTGSAPALLLSALSGAVDGCHLIVLNERESAAYFFNDLENIAGEKDEVFARKKILYYPTSYKRSSDYDQADKSNALARSEVFNRLSGSARRKIIVTYPEALAEKIITRQRLAKYTLKLNTGQDTSMDDLIDIMNDNGFERSDFVIMPGQFAVRGGILDVFSYSNDYPYRIEFAGDEIESIRTFDPVTQLSRENFNRITILPDVHKREVTERMATFFEFLPANSMVWMEDIQMFLDSVESERQRIVKIRDSIIHDEFIPDANTSLASQDELLNDLGSHRVIEFGKRFYRKGVPEFTFNQSPQPSFNKNFELLIRDLASNTSKGMRNLILSDNPRQIERLYAIFEDIQAKSTAETQFEFDTLNLSLHEGFLDYDLKIACYTDHQIFDRYHRFYLRDSFSRKESITLKDLYDLKPGDYVTHIDHGVGRFDGLEKIDNNGRQQEAIRIIYQNTDLLYVSIHSLHRIAKYVGKEGTPPRLDRLGSNSWNKLKAKTKNKVKDIARDLIKLYAERRASNGHSFAPDTYLQTELEASFIYEDTPDQFKATQDVKRDMQQSYPMDRLICGDVGFGKTEIAIRAAFKAVADSKQVAVLVPTTILALQHYNTFKERLKEFPANVEYMNRFKSPKEQKKIIESTANGATDILIGTHRLISKDIRFKDLGLLIIDEEQKFGVAAKERLKAIRVNVDTLTLTATPIPRTLQFSLMGARDLSIINTPPPNRYPVQTEIRSFGEDLIREAIYYEIDRGGQVFFVHNRVQNIQDVEQMLHKFCPDVRIAVAHGQMEGHKLENVMLGFINQDYDVLLATTIIESGLDIPNVNTIIINDAHNFGLSDLHQLRGRVGRTNKKAFCYLLTMPLSALTPEARKRLKAIEEFSDLGSGFNIAMRDLDIRGAGNILGAEQSGFISEIGFEMYQKILDEAILELKETDFKEFFKEEQAGRDLVSDCQIETDLELLIPDHYVTNIAERLSLYRTLDNADKESDLEEFLQALLDRFGPVPDSVKGLADAIRLRWLAKKAGFEKIILKNQRMIIQFISNQDSPYYQTSVFTGILKYVQSNPRKCLIKDKGEKLFLTLFEIRSVMQAMEEVREMLKP